MRICNENKIYMKYSLFWWLNFGTLKQFMMTMPFLTSIQLCLNSLYSDLHLKILLLFVGNQLKAEKVRLAISPLPLQQSKIWLNCAAAGRRPANLRKRNFLVSDNTTDFEKTTIQAHSALPPWHTHRAVLFTFVSIHRICSFIWSRYLVFSAQHVGCGPIGGSDSPTDNPLCFMFPSSQKPRCGGRKLLLLPGHRLPLGRAAARVTSGHQWGRHGTSPRSAFSF